MTNKQFLIGEIKKMLDRNDLADSDRVRLLALLAKHVPLPKPPKQPQTVKQTTATKPAKAGPFQRPPWIDDGPKPGHRTT
jgi:hypothetical protein